MSSAAQPHKDTKAEAVYKKLKTEKPVVGKETYLDTLRSFETHPQFKKGVPFLYPDTKGIITIGDGHNVQVGDRLANLKNSHAFIIVRNERSIFCGQGPVLHPDVGPPPTGPIGSPATPQDIQNDFDFLKKYYSHGYHSSHIRGIQLCTTVEIRLGSSLMDDLLKGDVLDKISIASRHIKDFYNIPLAAQAAIIDFFYNVRHPEQKAFGKAVINADKKPEDERWKNAENNLHRGDSYKKRDATVKAWLLDVSKQAAPSPSSSPSPNPSRTLP